MRIQFTQPTFVGTRTHAKGEAADLPDEQAKALVESGRAAPAKAKPAAVETATPTTDQPAETAAADDLPPKRRGR